MQDFRRLEVWTRARAFAVAVRIRSRLFPAGYGDLTRQLVRAAESIPANIVEGCGAASPREFARFLDISIKSASETEHHLQAAFDHGLLAEEDAALLSEVVEIRKMLFGLRKAVLAAADRGPRVRKDQWTSEKSELKTQN